MENSKIHNILRLIPILIGNRRTLQEIATLLNCSTRTVERYIEELRKANFVVQNRKKGVYFLSKNEGTLKDISDSFHFTQEEAFILHKAIDSIDDTNLLKQNLKKKLYKIYDFVELADVVVRPEKGENVKNLIFAISEKLCVNLVDYRSANSNKISTRIVEPFKFTTNYHQICCYDYSDCQNKLFNVARIGKVEVLEDMPWKNEDKHVFPEIDVFRLSNNGFIANVKLRLNVRSYNLIIEEYPLSENYITQMSENEFIANIPVCSFEGPSRFVLGLFDDIIVEGDEKFKLFLKEKINNFFS